MYSLLCWDHGENLKAKRDHNLDHFNKYLANANTDLTNVASWLPGLIAATIRDRQDKIAKSNAPAHTLDIPLRQDPQGGASAPRAMNRKLCDVETRPDDTALYMTFYQLESPAAVSTPEFTAKWSALEPASSSSQCQRVVPA